MNKNNNSDRAFILAATETNLPGSYAKIKRLLDFVFSLAAIIALSLPMLIIIAFIRADSKGNAVFKQKRVGRNGRLFDCYKFRTMKKDAPMYLSKKEIGNAEQFITKTGKFLRKTSLDELPQLFNIIKGDMSFIGPRPLIPEEKEVHSIRAENGVYALRPGISGYAQVHGRDLISDKEKAAFDTYYLENFSFKTDVKILFATVVKVLGEKDIHEGAIN
ncbi:MAG: sugar transferase [Oscillospiraceae bacterium]|nr:sugar transferase [Oscillospiraceae bacterium]